MTNICLICGRPTPDGRVCHHCGVTQAAQKLAEIAEVCPAARDVALGLSRRSQGGGSGKPGSRLPFDLGATAKLDGVGNVLGGWARVTAEERNGRPLAHGGEDPIVHAAHYLADNLEWWRHRPAVDEFLTDVDACLRVVRGIARGPAEQRYLGPCGAILDCCVDGECVQGETEVCGCWCHDGKPDTCDGDVYGQRGGHKGTCRTCGAQVDQAERRAWLDGEVRDHAFRASEIAGAYGVNVNTIRTWHARGLLVEHGRDRDDRPLFNVGEVLDLAAADAARRESKRAERERRAAKRVAESEDAA